METAEVVQSAQKPQVLAPMANPLPKPTSEQQTAIDAVLGFIADPCPDSWFFVLSGYAGTGKTFCMAEIVEAGKDSFANFVYTAPTNKATKVLRNITGQACTIYRFLGLRVDKSGEIKQIVPGKEPDLSEVDVIFIDEASQVAGNLFAILKAECEKTDTKVVFIGDPAQLPPVQEERSRVWEGELGAQLNTVMRYDNQILDLATRIRKVVNSNTPSIEIKNDHSETEGVWKLSRKAFKDSIFNAAECGDFADGAVAKVIAWRNVRVNEYNNLIRFAIYGAGAAPGTYMPGERIVAASPCMRGEKDMLLATDDEAVVESSVVCKHPFKPRYTCFELKCKTESNRNIRLLVIHPSSLEVFKGDCETLAHQARSTPSLWRKYWELRDIFHEVKYAYALTAHRAQGSTYKNVWVDYQDILYNRNRKEAFQCLYTACTRPTTKLLLA